MTSKILQSTPRLTETDGSNLKNYWFFVFLFVLSGGSGLIYQVIWARQLQLAFGVTAFAISAVLAAFFLGLALGSMIGGRFCDRVRKPLVWYGVVEIGIGVSALLLTPALTDLDIIVRPFDHMLGEHFWLLQGIRFILSIGVLIVPTTLIGATVPLMNRGLIMDLGHLGARAATLYASNTLGAVIGVILAGFFLIETFGLHQTTVFAAAVSIIVGCLCLITQRGKMQRQYIEASTVITAGTNNVKDDAIFRTIVLVMSLSGAMGLGLEIVWTRILIQSVGTTAYVFSVVLALFLVGITLGSFIAKFQIDKWGDLAARLAFCELMVALFTLLGIPVLGKIMPELTRDLMLTLGFSPGSEYFYAWIIWASGALLPITLFLGATWPIAVKLVNTELETVGNRIGILYAANTLGGVIGAVLVGFLLLTYAGIYPSLVSIALIQVILALILAVRFRTTITVLIPYILMPLAIIALVLFLLPSDMVRSQMLARVHGDVLEYKEDYYGSIALVEEESNGLKYKRLLVNGVSYSGTAPYAKRYMRLQGHIPMLVYPGTPERALVICFGVGLTAGAISTYPDMDLTVVELSRAILDMAGNFKDVNEDVVAMSNVKFVVGDGRNYLCEMIRSFMNVVTLEPPPPNHAGMANLYSEDFYRLVKDRLSPDGVVAQWIPLHTQSEADTKMLLGSVYHDFFQMQPYGGRKPERQWY